MGEGRLWLAALGLTGPCYGNENRRSEDINWGFKRRGGVSDFKGLVTPWEEAVGRKKFFYVIAEGIFGGRDNGLTRRSWMSYLRLYNDRCSCPQYQSPKLSPPHTSIKLRESYAAKP
ncbi:hypothetical protein ACMFMF_006588 [Clarireedia jacksonii]